MHVNADEITRIETIVDEITALKRDYINLEVELLSTQDELKKSQKINKILESDLSLYNDFAEAEKSYKSEIKSLKIKLKEKNTLSAATVVVEKCVTPKVFENRFPKLKMKEAFKESDIETIVYFDASSFRVNKEAFIYDKIDGKKIDKWEKSTSFTSNQKSASWIKVTGFFVDKVWQSAELDMWVKIEDASLRVEANKE